MITRRGTAVTATVVVAAAAIGLYLSARGEDPTPTAPTPDTSTSAASATTAPPSTTTPTTSPTSTATSSATAQPSVRDAARRFMHVYLAGNEMPHGAWVDQLRKVATPDLVDGLARTDVTNLPDGDVKHIDVTSNTGGGDGTTVVTLTTGGMLAVFVTDHLASDVRQAVQ